MALIEANKAERWAPVAAVLLIIPGWVAILLAGIYGLKPEWQALRPAALALAIISGPVWIPATIYEFRERFRGEQGELWPKHWLGLALTFLPTTIAVAQYEKAAPHALGALLVICLPLIIEWMLLARRRLSRKWHSWQNHDPAKHPERR